MAILEDDKQIIRLIREQGRSGANINQAFDIYNKYNPTKRFRKKWCGGCSNSVYEWITKVEL